MRAVQLFNAYWCQFRNDQVPLIIEDKRTLLVLNKKCCRIVRTPAGRRGERFPHEFARIRLHTAQVSLATDPIHVPTSNYRRGHERVQIVRSHWIGELAPPQLRCGGPLTVELHHE